MTVLAGSLRVKFVFRDTPMEMSVDDALDRARNVYFKRLGEADRILEDAYLALGEWLTAIRPHVASGRWGYELECRGIHRARAQKAMQLFEDNQAGRVEEARRRLRDKGCAEPSVTALRDELRAMRAERDGRTNTENLCTRECKDLRDMSGAQDEKPAFEGTGAGVTDWEAAEPWAESTAEAPSEAAQARPVVAPQRSEQVGASQGGGGAARDLAELYRQAARMRDRTDKLCRWVAEASPETAFAIAGDVRRVLGLLDDLEALLPAAA